MEQGIITPSTKERMMELESEKQETEAAIVRERTGRPLITKDFVLFWLSKFQVGDIKDITFCRRLIDTFINSIFLYDDKVVITYNYKGKRKTLKLKDIKDGSDLKESAPPQQENPNPLPIGGGIGFLLLFCLLIHRAPSPCISKNCISISILTILTGNIYRNISSGALKKSSKVQEYISCNPTSRLTGIFNSQVSIREYTFLLISIPMRFNFATS